MKPILLAICVAFIGIACNNLAKEDEKKAITADDIIIPQQGGAASSTTQADSVPKNIQVDSVIHLAFAPGSAFVTVKGFMGKKGDPVICYLPVTTGKKLTASVAGDNKKATIRFSHIYLPDGKSDGPFGNTLKYSLRQKGTYKIYIGSNRMAGDRVSSDFVLNVKVE